jgi:integrase
MSLSNTCRNVVLFAKNLEETNMAAVPIRKMKDVKNIINYFLNKGNLRNYLLIVMGINTALRISDLLMVRWADVYDFKYKRFRKHLTLKEKKTGKRQSIVLNSAILSALNKYFLHVADKNLMGEEYIFANNRRSKDGKVKPISRQQAYRIINEAGEGSHTGYRVTCHSLRKTFGYHAWRNGVHVALLVEIYNHSGYEMTRRYLGIAQDEQDEVYLKIKLR